MPTMTRVQYNAGLDRIWDQFERDYGDQMSLPPAAALMDESLARFKASATIVESAPTRRPGRPAAADAKKASAGQAVRSAAVAASASRPTKRERRIARAVTQALTGRTGPQETVTAAAAPSLPPGTGLSRKPALARSATPSALHQLDGDQLAAATVAAMGSTSASPFWTARESAPPAPVTESLAAAVPGKPLHEMSLDEFGQHAAALITDRARSQGFGSPIWAA